MNHSAFYSGEPQRKGSQNEISQEINNLANKENIMMNGTMGG